ncbi:beta strand repeat-containing protein [Halochromatium roseum]|uniref:beta strand repeat-containing protein n=1 Tax=Halochromatium roseum TaxID=391920 RepID=UPI001911FF14|nr:hypothetical protein [Halochromatium roseum]MBK5937909.1 hypothetical protein [Halochromatium roseum]
MITEAQQQNIIALTVGMFNAAPGANNLTDFANNITASGGDFVQLANDLAATAIFNGMYAGRNTLAQQIDTALGMLGIASGTDAYDIAAAHFTARAEQGWTAGEILLEASDYLMNSEEVDPAFTDIAAAFQNKVAVASYFSVDKQQSADTLANLQLVVSSVTADPATVDAAKTAIDSGSLSPDEGGQTFAFTTAAGETLTGTNGNDTFTGIVGTTDTTFQTGDTANGMGGTDTLNLIVSSNVPDLPAGAGTDSIEIINLDVSTNPAGATLLTSNAYTGVEQLWQVDNNNGTDDFANVTVGAGVTAGFRSTGATATAAQAGETVTAASGTQKTIAAAVDGVDAGSTITLAGAGLETATISGNVAGSATGLTVTGVANITTLNLGISDNSVLTLNTFGGVTAVNSSQSSGNFSADISGFGDLESYVGGAGGETITFDLEVGNDVTVNMGSGNDVAVLVGTVAPSNKASSITLGAGNDTLDINAIGNIFNADEAAFQAGLITVDDFSAAEDVLDVAGLTASRLATNTEQSNIDAEASLFAAIGVAAGIANGNALVFGYSGNTYVLDDNDGSATFNTLDGLVELTGVAVSDLGGTNFVS